MAAKTNTAHLEHLSKDKILALTTYFNPNVYIFVYCIDHKSHDEKLKNYTSDCLYGNYR